MSASGLSLFANFRPFFVSHYEGSEELCREIQARYHYYCKPNQCKVTAADCCACLASRSQRRSAGVCERARHSSTAGTCKRYSWTRQNLSQLHRAVDPVGAAVARKDNIANILLLCRRLTRALLPLFLVPQAGPGHARADSGTRTAKKPAASSNSLPPGPAIPNPTPPRVLCFLTDSIKNGLNAPRGAVDVRALVIRP